MAQGGRPPVVLPTEREEIPLKYRILQNELKLLRLWLRGQGQKVGMNDVWGWLCRLRRQGKIRILFFWPEFFHWLAKNHEQEAFYNCVWLPSDVAREFLAAEYVATERTIRRIVTPH